MMKNMAACPALARVPLYGDFGDSHNGAAVMKVNGVALRVLFSNGGGWDHVSVSLPSRCPTWDEMCAVKALFFEPEDVVVQYHPRATEYRNEHPYCLHLWRAQAFEFPTPPPIFVA